MRFTISAPRVLTGLDDLGPGWVQVTDGTVTAVGAGPRPGADVVLDEGVLAPGLVDAQINGAFGVDFADADADGWAAVATGLARTGVTAFVPTVITAPVPEICATLRRFAALRPGLEALPGAAHALGVHVEGPFLAPARRGAHREDLLQDPRPDLVASLVEAGVRGALRYVTLAPERTGAVEAVRRLRDAGVLVSVGHSDATVAQVRAAVDAGATLATHLYNAQSPLRHRAPGVVGAALSDTRLTCGLIADGHHVAPEALRIAFAARPGGVMLVTDALSALGMPEGTYVLGGDEVVLRTGEPARRTDGTIAGAACPLDEALGVAVAAGVGVREAVEAATRVPADALGEPGRGRIAPGLGADLVWLAPHVTGPLRARSTWVRGVRVGGVPADERSAHAGPA